MKFKRSRALKLMLITSVLVFAVVASVLPVSANPITALLDIPSGPVGTKVNVSGVADTLGGLVEIYWDTMATKIADTYASGSGSYSKSKIVIPEDEAGDHYIIVKDAGGASAAVVFTITPMVEVDPEAGQPEDEIEVSGTGFGAEKDVTLMLNGEDVTPDDLITDDLGSFTATFEVPDLAYGIYTLTASDNVTNSDTASFRIGATIEVTPEEGPTGTIVDIDGRGFLGDEVDVWIDGVLVLDDVELDSNGDFSETFVVPSDSLVVGDLTVMAEDDLANSAEADFELTGVAEIEVDPEVAASGTEVTITGVNFTAEAGVEVTVTFASTEVGTFLTSSSGSFAGTFDVPAIPPGVYTIEAEDENDVTATTTFTVVLTYVALVPTRGNTGEEVYVMGLGFTALTDFNVTIDGKLMVDGEGTTAADGDVGITVIIPTVPVGVYTVTVMDEDGVTGTAFLTVEETTTLEVDPSSAPVDYEVDIEGTGFSALTPVDVILYNSTWEWEFGFSPILTNSSGGFMRDFDVPDIDLGAYTINATDANGLTVEIPFTIVEPEINVWPRAEEYVVGDKISFIINCTFDFNLRINITDSTGMNILDIWADWWKQEGEWWICPYSGLWPKNPMLPDDAPVGTYTWSAVDLSEDEIVASGTFEVVAKASLEDLVDKIDELTDMVSNMTSDLSALMDDVEALDEIADDLTDIKSDVASIKGEFPVSVSVDQTPTWAAVALSLVAALASIWCVMTVSRKIA